MHLRLFRTWIPVFALSLSLFPALGVHAQDAGPFAEEIAAFEAWDRKNAWPEAPVLFVGSSSIRLWNTAEAFPDLPVLNRGFGGSQISEVNHYLDRVVLKYRPRAIVFYAGDNDVTAGKTPEQVAGDFRVFTSGVHAVLPETPILYITIKPSLARWSLWPQMQEVNAFIAELAGENRLVHVADVGPAMLGPDGKPRPELLADDGLHLTKAGYEVWDRVVGDALRAILAR